MKRTIKTMLFCTLAMSFHMKAADGPKSVQKLLDQGENLEVINADGQWMLVLSNKGLESLEGIENIPNIEKVQILDLENNKLVSFKGLPALPQLEVLAANDNQIKSAEGFPKKLPKLSFLSLMNNKLESFDVQADQLPNIETMLLEENPISDIAQYPKEYNKEEVREARYDIKERFRDATFNIRW